MNAKPDSEGMVIVQAGTCGGRGWDEAAIDRWLGEFTEQGETHLLRLTALTSTALDALAQLHLPDNQWKAAARPAGPTSNKTRPPKRRLAR